jgi:hypothetical protein
MKRKTILLVILALVLVMSLFVFRPKETYVLPDVSAFAPDVCPVGFVLTCVSKNLVGITDTIPFPDSLPKPCEDTYTPLCLPGPEHIKPAYTENKK